MTTAKGWSRAFDDPIAMPDGRALDSLAEAGHHLAGLPKAEQQRPEWQTATEALLLVAERGGPTMLARIGMMRALNRSQVHEFNSDRKPHHWGKR